MARVRSPQVLIIRVNEPQAVAAPLAPHRADPAAIYVAGAPRQGGVCAIFAHCWRRIVVRLTALGSRRLLDKW